MQLQDILEQCDVVLESLREEYECGLAEGIQLLTFEALVQHFRIDSA